MLLPLWVSKGQIIRRVVLDVLLSMNVLNVESEKRSRRLGNSAILAPVLSPLAHEPASGCIHQAVSAVASSRFRALICNSVMN